MKIRSDFVSNSSSSSYIVSCKAANVDNFIKDLAKACTCKVKNEWHDPKLKKRNERILNFCFNSFELMFLGSLVLETKKEKYDLAYFEREYKDFLGYGDKPEKFFETYKKDVKNAKNKKARKWQIRDYGRDKKIPGEDAYWHFIDVEVRGIILDKDSCEYELNHYNLTDKYGNSNKDKLETINERVKKMIQISKSKINSYSNVRTMSTIDTYEITLDTVSNTRELINAGYKINFDEYEDLDMIEKKLKDGNRIFYLRIAYSGDGYGTFYIYHEDGAPGLNANLPVEIICCCD